MKPTSNPQYFFRFSNQTQQPVSNLSVNDIPQIVTAPILLLLFWVMIRWLSDNVWFNSKNDD